MMRMKGHGYVPVAVAGSCMKLYNRTQLIAKEEKTRKRKRKKEFGPEAGGLRLHANMGQVKK